jgi:hypothetical protein
VDRDLIGGATGQEFEAEQSVIITQVQNRIRALNDPQTILDDHDDGEHDRGHNDGSRELDRSRELDGDRQEVHGIMGGDV